MKAEKQRTSEERMSDKCIFPAETKMKFNVQLRKSCRQICLLGERRWRWLLQGKPENSKFDRRKWGGRIRRM